MPAMTLTYGIYTHPDVMQVTPEISIVRSQDGTALYQAMTYQVSGKLWAADASAIDTKIDALVAAYADDGRDFSLAYPGGGDTEVAIDNDDSLGGIRVAAPPTVQGSGGSGTYVVVWPYSLAIETALELYDDDYLVEFSETIGTIYGGAPLVGRESLTELPVIYRPRAHSVFRYRQSGRIVGWKSYPTLPPPKVTANEDQSARTINYEQPTQIGTAERIYPITYTYEFVASEALTGMTPMTFAEAQAGQ